MLKINDLTKMMTGNVIPILDHISCDLNVGKIIGLLGPSGSGKTTLLRCIARLEETPGGKIFFQNREIHTLSSTEIGMVFQNFNLFPHMSIFENLCYAPKKGGKMSKQDIEDKALKLLNDFGLSDKKDKFPSQLSGGQKQRVAIMRTLMLDPRIILFDEPTSALDPEMVTDVATMIHQLKSPDRLIIMATHELRICQLIADHVLFLDKGHLVDNLEKVQFFKKPMSERAKVFLSNVMIQQ